MSEKKGKILLVAFYNIKAQGVRYLETALEKGGYEVSCVFYKDFNSVRPKKTTEAELDLLCSRIEAVQPDMIGLSVMSSMYLDTVNAVLERIKGKFSIPVVCGGAFTSMFPEYFLDRGAEYVIRTDGEHAIVRLADAVMQKSDWRDIPSLGWRENGENHVNDIGDVLTELDGYGAPVINSRGACFIENDKLVEGDPQLGTLSYETIASRGCPFQCSYCCCSNLRKLLPKGTPPVRFRSVKSVIDELIEAKKQCHKLVFIHFYDEVFPRKKEWVDEFVREYKKHIHMPFTIWTHPGMVDEETLKKLVSVGLMEVIMGIQSGSPYIRREVFHRRETQEDIIEATRAISAAGVFWASYDFMLQHPFEKIEHLKETYYLVKQLHGRYELQLHGLNFLPGTDIVPMAIEQGYFTQDEMDAVMYAPMEEQFGAYWKRENSVESRLWYELTYLLQYKDLRPLAEKYESDPLAHEKEIDAAYAKGKKKEKNRYLYKKSRIALKRVLF
jgi:anaerobic magnesium-protoporphyrin IX monomethyl ester cyclase